LRARLLENSSLSLVWQRAASVATLPDIAAFALAPPGYPHHVRKPFRCESCPAIQPWRMYPAVSVKRSKTKKRQNRPGEILKGAPRCMVETVETRQRNTDHGCRPRLYTTRSRSISSTSPPKLKSSRCLRAYSNLAINQASNGELCDIQSSGRNTNNSSGAHSTTRRRTAT
jgi:hypothetical protein